MVMDGLQRAIDRRVSGLLRPYLKPFDAEVVEVGAGTEAGKVKVRLPGETATTADLPWAPVSGAVPSVGSRVFVVADFASRRVIAGGSGGGVTDHGALTGLGDDDHPQYALDSDLAVHVGSGGSAHATAVAGSPGAAGFQSGSDKQKLDGIAAGAQVNPTNAQIRNAILLGTNTQLASAGLSVYDNGLSYMYVDSTQTGWPLASTNFHILIFKKDGTSGQQEARQTNSGRRWTRYWTGSAWSAWSEVTDHGNLTGLSDDDHPQYHTDGRGDARYAPLSHTSASDPHTQYKLEANEQLAEDSVTGSTPLTSSSYPAGISMVRVTASSSGWPVASTAFTVQTVKTANDRGFQLAFGAASEEFYERRWDQGSSTWGAWVNVLYPGVSRIGTGTPAAGKYVDGGTGAWTTLPSGGGSSDPITSPEYFDDFVSALATAGNIGSLGWDFAVSTVTLLAGESGRPGIVRRSSGATANNQAYLALRDAPSTGVIDVRDMFDMTWSIRVNQVAVSNQTVRVGFVIDPTLNPGASGIFFEHLGGGDGTWRGICRSASVQSTTPSLGALDTSWVKLRLRRVDASTIGFSVDGGTEQTLSANIPTDAHTPAIYLRTLSATARTYDVDYFRLKISGLSR